MYNHDRKAQYLKEKSKKSDISDNLRGWFEQAEFFEEKRNTDICEWNTNEIIEFMKYIGTPRIQVLILMSNQFALYTDWCLLNRLVKDNQNHFRELGQETLCQCIDMDKFRQYVFSKQQIYEHIEKLPNYQDKFMYLGTFEGFTAKNLASIKIGDVNRNIANVSDGRMLEISKRLITLMSEANEELIYSPMSDELKKMPCLKTDTVIKPFDRKNARSGPSLILSRFKKCATYLGLSEMNFKDISESGRLEFIRNIMKERNITLSEAISGDTRRIVEYYYGKIQNRLTYMNTYGQLI